MDRKIASTVTATKVATIQRMSERERERAIRQLIKRFNLGKRVQWIHFHTNFFDLFSDDVIV